MSRMSPGEPPTHVFFKYGVFTPQISEINKSIDL
jgi:hypothetical protein